MISDFIATFASFAVKSAMRQAFHDLLGYGVGAGGNLFGCLVLNRMRHIDSVEAGTAESTRLGARGSDELSCSHSDCRDAKIF